VNNRRILVVDDNPSLHEDFKKILIGNSGISNELLKASAKELFGEGKSSPVTKLKFDLDFASQGEEAFDKALSAHKENKPYALIFMDVRMPPGWDGIMTIKKIWEEVPQTEVVICTAFSDYSLDEVIIQFGISDRFLFLKKPFDSVEVQQLALALTAKWDLGQFNRLYLENLEALVEEKIKEVETERARSIQGSKLAALGEMAVGIAHEINNPLAIIQANVDFMKDVVEKEFDKTTLLKIANKIEETTTRVAKIIKGLRSFASSGENDPFESMSIEQTILETLGICSEKFKINDIGLSFEKPKNKVLVECRQTQLVQVFLNLLNNAYDAVQECQEKWVKIEVKEKNDAVEIGITDSGKGISPELQKKLFSPFFTTKGVGKGTGLGLSVSRGIITEHNGTLLIDNSCSHTKFVIHLPLKQSTVDQKRAV